jgi:hypothetical protein
MTFGERSGAVWLALGIAALIATGGIVGVVWIKNPNLLSIGNHTSSDTKHFTVTTSTSMTSLQSPNYTLVPLSIILPH